MVLYLQEKDGRWNSVEVNGDKGRELYEKYSEFTVHNIQNYKYVGYGAMETYFPSRETAVKLYNIIRNQLIDNNRALYGWDDVQLDQFCGNLFDMRRVYVTLLAYDLVERQGGMIDFEREVTE